MWLLLLLLLFVVGVVVGVSGDVGGGVGVVGFFVAAAVLVCFVSD